LTNSLYLMMRIACRDMQNQSDAELMKLVLDKQRSALEQLYDRYVKLVYSFALKSTKDEQRARSIVQGVFTRLWTTKVGYDESRGAFPSWLLTVTRNCIIDEMRKDSRHRDHIYIEETAWQAIQDHAPEHHPEAAAMHSLRREQVQQALKRLSERQAQLLRLLYWEGYSLREIAEKSNEPLGTIKSRLNQTFKVLRQHLHPEKEV